MGIEETVSTECSSCQEEQMAIENFEKCPVCGNLDCPTCFADNTNQCTRCNPPN